MTEPTKITFFGHSMFLIESSGGVKIGMDPYNQQVKDQLPDVRADIVFISHKHFDHANISLFKGKPTIIDKPEKINIKGIDIQGLKTYHDQSMGSQRGSNIIFKFKVDDINFAHMGDLGHMLSTEQCDQLEGVNILMLPIGGIYTIDSKSAHEIIATLKPQIAIPMHYKEKDTKIGVDTFDAFLRETAKYEPMGHTANITKDQLPKSTEIWVLKSS